MTRPDHRRPKRALLRADTVIDYKDTDLLRKFISDRGKIRSRRITGATVQQQRRLAKAIKQRANWPCSLT